MRILMTGMTRMQTGGGSKAGVVCTGEIFAGAFREAGHTVEFRETTPGEDLSVFDAVVCGIAKPNAIICSQLFTALDVINRAIASGCKLGFFIDDWDAENIPSGLRTYCKNGPRLVFGLRTRKFTEWAEENVDTIMATLNALLTYPWPPTLVPAFPWGDHQRLVGASGMEGSGFVFVDPSTGTPRLEFATPTERERVWVLPSLAKIGDANEKRIKRLRLQWPVEHYGPKGHVRLKETEIVDRYAQTRGVLAQPYKQVGSGWWRVRYIHAVWTRSVLVTVDRNEVPAMLPAYHLPVDEIEAMSDADLDHLADAQAEELRSCAWSRDQLVAALEAYLVSLPSAVGGE